MATTTFTRLPFAVAGAIAPLDITKVQSLLTTGREPDAAGHWIFGADNPTMVDLVSAQKMQRTPFAAITTGGAGYSSAPVAVATGWGGTRQPTFVTGLTGGAVVRCVCTDPGEGCDSVGVVTLSGGAPTAAAVLAPSLGGAPTHGRGILTLAKTTTENVATNNGLIAPIADAVVQTRIAVVQFPIPQDLALIFGTQTSETSTGGSGMIHNTQAFKLETRTLATFQVAADADVATGEAYVALVETTSGASRAAFVSGGKGYFSEASGKASVGTTLTRKVGLGNCYGRGAPYDAPLKVAEFIVINATKTEAEIRAILGRSQLRLAPRGAGFTL